MRTRAEELRIKTKHALAPIEVYKNSIFRGIFYSVWIIIILYIIFFGLIEARLAFWNVLLHGLVLFPIIFLLEHSGHKKLSRQIFIIGCNLCILLSSLGFSHELSIEYFFIPAVILPLLILDGMSKWLVIVSIATTLAAWAATSFMVVDFIPSSWIAMDVPVKLVKSVNFIGAVGISLVFVSIFKKTNTQLKEILLENIQFDFNSEKLLSQQLNEAQSIAKTGSWNFDIKSNKLIWSSEHYRIFELDEPQPQTELYRMYRERIHPADLPVLDNLVDRAVRLGENYVFDHRIYLDGGTRLKFVRGIGKVIKSDSGETVSLSGTCQDITQQVAIQSELVKSKAILENIINASPSIVFLKDTNGNYILCNETYAELHAKTPEEMIGKNVYQLYPKTVADHMTKKDREIVEGRVAKTFEEQFPVKGVMTWHLVTLFPLIDAHKSVYGVGGIVTNIQEAKDKQLQYEIEIELERAKATHNAKLASLGEVSAGIAHEINNPLAIILGTVALIERNKEDPEKLREKLESITKSGHRIEKIVKNLKKYSRTSERGVRKVEDLQSIITEALVLTEPKSKRHSTPVRTEVAPGLFINCDQVEIEQVVINLINNAIDAVKKLEDRWIKINAFLENEEIVLQVIDSGSGIEPDVEARLFQPFFTTKPVGEGTGLGLSITKGILDEHQATICVNRKLKNTCFEIRFKNVKSKIGGVQSAS